MKKQMKIIAMVAAVLLITLLVTFFAQYRHKRTEVTMYCAEITTDCEVLDTGTFTLEGLRQKIRKSKSEFHVKQLQILDLAVDVKYDNPFIVYEYPDGLDFYDIFGVAYFGEYHHVEITMGSQGEWAVIRVDDRLFVASTQKDLDAVAIKEIYEERFDTFFE